jgi:alkylresorcinol/alkylpyrone synthase
MTDAAILSLATGTPPHQYQQMDIHDRWLAPFINSPRARAIFAAAEIDTRFSVLADADFLADEPGTQARNNLYMQAARPLAAAVIDRALLQAQLTPADIDHFIVVSCTGFDCPGLDVLLAADLGMRPDLRRSALIGMGCHAGLTGLDRAMLELAARPQSRVLLLTVEFGTLHFQHGKSIENMVAGAIFGDGLAAAVIGPANTSPGGPCLRNSMTFTEPAAQGLMAFNLTDKGFQIKLATRVPKVLRNVVPGLVDDFLTRSGVRRADVRFWGIHPGGAKIVDYLQAALALQPEDVRFSRQVLRRYGNMSSATIFFVLDEIIRAGQPRPGDYVLLQGFGPGITVELCLLQW